MGGSLILAPPCQMLEQLCQRKLTGVAVATWETLFLPPPPTLLWLLHWLTLPFWCHDNVWLLFFELPESTFRSVQQHNLLHVRPQAVALWPSLRTAGPGTGKKATISDLMTLARVWQPGALKAPYVVRERSSHVKAVLSLHSSEEHKAESIILQPQYLLHLSHFSAQTTLAETMEQDEDVVLIGETGQVCLRHGPRLLPWLGPHLPNTNMLRHSPRRGSVILALQA